MKRIPTIIGVVLVIGLAACSGSDSEKAKVIGKVDSSSTTTTTTKPELPSHIGTVGDKIRSARGNEMTIYTYEQPTAVGQFSTPDPGKEFAAIDVEGCATGDLTTFDGAPVPPDEQFISMNPFNYVLLMPDNTRLESSFGKDPALNDTQLTTGQCVRGWVTFQVPVGQRPTAVIDKNTGPPNLQWNIG